MWTPLFYDLHVRLLHHIFTYLCSIYMGSDSNITKCKKAMNEYNQNTYAICVGRSFGSGGGEFAKKLSDALGIPIYDKNILDKAAEDANIRRELFERMDESNNFSIPMVYGAGFSVPSSFFVYTDNYLSNENLFRMQAETIQELARKSSAIFVGRCSDFVLRDHPHMLSVFVTEDKERRLRRIQERIEDVNDEEEALKMMEKLDKERREYYNYYTGGHWGRAENYDLSFKTTVVGMDYAVNHVVELIEHLGFLTKDKPGAQK